MDFATQGEWGWTDRTVQSNLGSGLAEPGRRLRMSALTGYQSWRVCVPTASGPDQVYRINGTTGGSATRRPMRSVAYTNGDTCRMHDLYNKHRPRLDHAWRHRLRQPLR